MRLCIYIHMCVFLFKIKQPSKENIKSRLWEKRWERGGKWRGLLLCCAFMLVYTQVPFNTTLYVVLRSIDRIKLVKNKRYFLPFFIIPFLFSTFVKAKFSHVNKNIKNKYFENIYWEESNKIKHGYIFPYV